jgi:hypothetical protein
LGICKNPSGAPEIAQEIKMSGMSNMSNRVIVETKCTFCGKEINGTPHELTIYNGDKMSQMIAFQCKNCDTIVCKDCKGKQVKWSIWTGFAKTDCPRCGKKFGPGVMFEGLSPKDISREKEQRMERISQAELGVFYCVLMERNMEVDGSYCYLYNNQAADVSFKEDGLNFRQQLVFYRNKTAANIGKNSQNASIASLLVTAGTTETVSLAIPWTEIKECRKISFYHRLIFNNSAKKRQEWLDIAVFKSHEEDIQEKFLSWLKKYGVPVTDMRATEKVA